jgi:hypothetical protein
MVYNFPDHISGDTWNGITLTILESGIPLNLTDCDIFIQFRPIHNLASPVFLELTSDKNKIGVIIPEQGLISTNIINFDIPADTYNYDLQINFPNGDTKTYLKCTIKVLPQTTRIKNDFTNLNNQKLIITGDRQDRILSSNGERLSYL